MKLAVSTTSLLVGGLTYVFWRPQTLRMFDWFDRFGLADSVHWIRAEMSWGRAILPRWVVYSLPNALWLFGGLLAFDVIWGSGPARGKTVWLCMFAAIAVGSEVGQALGLVPGTFDWQDMLTMVIAGLCGVSVILGGRSKESRRFTAWMVRG